MKILDIISFCLVDIPVFVIALVRILRGGADAWDYVLVTVSVVGAVLCLLDKKVISFEGSLLVLPVKRMVLSAGFCGAVLILGSIFRFVATPMVILTALVLLIPGAVFCTLEPGHITVRFLCLPVRRIYWHEWSDLAFLEKDGIKKDFKMVMTKRPCKAFDESEHCLLLFLLRHPFRAVCIRVAGKNSRLIREAAKEYFARSRNGPSPIR